MRKQEITSWTNMLISSFGGIRPQADREELLALYLQKDFTSMLRTVRNSLGLDMPLQVGYVNSGGPNAPAWVRLPEPMPVYGTHAFKTTKLTVYLRKTFLVDMPFAGVVHAMAHELSHVILDSIGHSLRRQEEAVDLTAMVLGYRDIFLEETQVRTVDILDSPRSWFDKLTGSLPIPGVRIGYETHNVGYLSRDERFFAASLMK
jgi:hypothetical protein